MTYSLLSRLVESEGVEAGGSARRRLWSTLLIGADDLPELADFDFNELAQRAEDQPGLLREFREYAAKAAFDESSV